MTEENVKKYSARASAYKKKLTDLCDANSDVLRLDKQRLSLHGVLSVDNKGRLSVTPKANKNATTGKIEGKKANVVQGKRLVGKVDYANSKFDHNIEAAMNAQGYDGKPSVVSRKEFDEAMKKSGFYAERTYSANSKEVLNAYQNELYNGKWYVDCSTGGAQYGQGMYCAAAYDEMNHKYDYTNKDSLRGIAEEMRHYKELNTDRGNKLSKTESITLQSDAKIYTLRSGMPRDITERYVNEYCKERVTDEKAKKAVDRLIEIDEMEQRREKMNYNAIAWEKRQLKADIPSEIRDEAWEYVKDKDPGVLAVEMGYDAINAMGHGESRSYTVILNRTKVIFCEGGSIHGN